MASRQPKDTKGESPDEKRLAREQAQRESEIHLRERDDARRRMFTFLKLWTICPDRRCMRAHACSGDVEQCARDRWHPVVPDETKALIQKFIQLMNDGVPAVEAVRLAQEHVDKVKRSLALLEQHTALAPPAPPARAKITRAAPRVERGPRIRAL